MSRNPARIPIVLKHLEELWKEHPDLRLGQIIFCVSVHSGMEDCFSIEDDALVRRFLEFREKHKPKEQDERIPCSKEFIWERFLNKLKGRKRGET